MVNLKHYENLSSHTIVYKGGGGKMKARGLYQIL